MTAPLMHLQRRLLAVHDARLRRCWFCGAWAYAADDCAECTAPADRSVLIGEAQ